jgi:Flp pilus assembly pilin Flp
MCGPDFDPKAPVTRKALLVRFVTEEGGQDIVEYGLLAAFIGIAGYLTLEVIEGEILTTYLSWINPATGTPSVWEPPPPTAPPP